MRNKQTHRNRAARKRLAVPGRWVLVANQSRMRIFATEPDGKLVQVTQLDNPRADEQAREIVTDRPGRAFDSRGEGRHAMEPSVDPKEQEAIRFAKAIADEIENARSKNEFQKLVLVAGPEFLGRIRAELTDAAAKTVEREIGKNLTHLDEAEVRAYLREHA